MLILQCDGPNSFALFGGSEQKCKMGDTRFQRTSLAHS